MSHRRKGNLEITAILAVTGLRKSKGYTPEQVTEEIIAALPENQPVGDLLKTLDTLVSRERWNKEQKTFQKARLTFIERYLHH